NHNVHHSARFGNLTRICFCPPSGPAEGPATKTDPPLPRTIHLITAPLFPVQKRSCPTPYMLFPAHKSATMRYQDTSPQPPVITPLVFDQPAANDATKRRRGPEPVRKHESPHDRLFHAFLRTQSRAETDNTLPGPAYKPRDPSCSGGPG
ncbi:hypothetical protein Bbelb_096370, partial [Branchiostoma belcheri]